MWLPTVQVESHPNWLLCAGPAFVSWRHPSEVVTRKLDSGVRETWVYFLDLLNKLCDLRQVTPCF